MSIVKMFRKVLENNNFQFEMRDQLFFGKKKKEMFIFKIVKEDGIQDFFESEDYKNIISLYEREKSKESYLQHNTTLILIINSDQLSQVYKQSINEVLKIEENPHYFKKNVIFLNNDFANSLDLDKNIELQLERIITRKGGIDSFEKNFSDDTDYFIAIQIIIKLTFLNLNYITETFEDIKLKLKTAFAENPKIMINKSHYDEVKFALENNELHEILDNELLFSHLEKM